VNFALLLIDQHCWAKAPAVLLRVFHF